MSDWKESNNLIDVPYQAGNKFMCVEHPGLIVNTDKALKTLGGLDNVSKVKEDPTRTNIEIFSSMGRTTDAQQVYSSPVKRMGLQWRPEDIYCKSAFADRYNVTNLLMKVKSRRRKSDGHTEYSITIEGIIGVTYKYQSLCDFQYLPMVKKPDASYESIYKSIVIDLSTTKQEYYSRQVPLFIPPLTFSRVDKPCDFLYRQDIEHRNPYVNPDKNRPANLIGTVRQRRSIYTIFVNFGETVPTGPIPASLDKLKADFVNPDGAAIVNKLLDEKPLWLKAELEHRSGLRGDKLKIFLPPYCFYWLDGPWRGQWNKFGFDPTKQPSAKIYQTIDFRIRPLSIGKFGVKAKRSDLKMSQWNMLSRNQKHNVKIDLNSLGEDKNKDNVALHDYEIQYKFYPDKVPPQRMMYYPAMYVFLDEVQKLLHQNDGKEKRCTDRDGWCMPRFSERARDIMYLYVNKLLDLPEPYEQRLKRRRKKVLEHSLTLGGEEDEDDDIDEVLEAVDVNSAGPSSQTESVSMETENGGAQELTMDITEVPQDDEGGSEEAVMDDS